MEQILLTVFFLDKNINTNIHIHTFNTFTYVCTQVSEKYMFFEFPHGVYPMGQVLSASLIDESIFEHTYEYIYMYIHTYLHV
jgi:hypothetical protein